MRRTSASPTPTVRPTGSRLIAALHNADVVSRSATVAAPTPAGANAVGMGLAMDQGRRAAAGVVSARQRREAPDGTVTGVRARLDKSQPSTGLTLDRRYLPAPPPVSVRPASAGPPLPEVARPTAGRQPSIERMPAPSAQADRESVVRATAALFASIAPSEPAIARFHDGTGGQHVSVFDGYASPEFGEDGTRFAEPVAPASISNDELERLVDKVVDKIEQRVIDELERRGRRHNPGVF
jgi:hypothetical protein